MPQIDAPTASDWQGYESNSDATWAHGQLSGKTQAELWQYFESDPINAMEDIYRVPDKALPYYIASFGEFAKSIINYGDDLLKASAASALFNYTAALLSERPESLNSIAGSILDALLYIADNQLQYGADEHVYGSFPDLYKNIEARMRS